MSDLTNLFQVEQPARRTPANGEPFRPMLADFPARETREATGVDDFDEVEEEPPYGEDQ